jgi:hypothetical protein
MMSPEVAFTYWHLLWFRPLTSDYVEPEHALYIKTNMYAGPIRFRLLVDVDEDWATAQLGSHDRHELKETVHSVGTPYGLMDFNGDSVVLVDLLPKGDYHPVLLSAGVDPTLSDLTCDHSEERYWLILKSISAGQDPSKMAS